MAAKSLDLKLLLTRDMRAGKAADEPAIEALLRQYTGTGKSLEELWHDCLGNDCKGGLADRPPPGKT